MDTDSENTRAQKGSRLSFRLSTLLLLMATVAISLGWWNERNRATTQQYDIAGPAVVSFKVRTSQSSTSGATIDNVQGINYRGDNVIVYTEKGGTVISGSNLINFTWNKK